MFDLYEHYRYFTMTIDEFCKTLNPPVPLTFTNATDSDEVKAAIDEGRAWGRVTLRENTDATTLTLGNNQYHEISGRCYVQIFTPVNTFVGQARQIAGQIATHILTNRRNEPVGLTTFTPAPTEYGEDAADGDFYRYTIAVPFTMEYYIENVVV